jgi:hypothetical protein
VSGVPALPNGFSQRMLSDRLEDRWIADCLGGAPSGDRASVHWRLCALPGTAGWLDAMPSIELGQAISPALFRVLLRRRLGVPVYAHVDHCPCCQAVNDVWGDHAVACPAGGDRTRRHNRIRNEIAALAEAAGHAPAVERPHLLPARPTILYAPEDGSTPGRGASDQRRPADVYVPAWWCGRPGAIDAAVTSGLTESALPAAARDASAPARLYEMHKRRYAATEAQCGAAGITFVPFVVEAEGGLGPSALKVLASIADDAGRLIGIDRDSRAAQAKQRISIALQTHNAAAILARAPRPRVAAAPGALDVAAWAQAAAQSPQPVPAGALPAALAAPHATVQSPHAGLPAQPARPPSPPPGPLPPGSPAAAVGVPAPSRVDAPLWAPGGADRFAPSSSPVPPAWAVAGAAGAPPPGGGRGRGVARPDAALPQPPLQPGAGGRGGLPASWVGPAPPVQPAPPGWGGGAAAAWAQSAAPPPPPPPLGAVAARQSPLPWAPPPPARAGWGT